MSDPARGLFDSLNDYSKIQELIDNGEAEGLHLECKSPGAPQLTRDMKAKLAEAVSGFANTGGGVILYGVSTTKHSHSGLDILTQIEPIGHVRRLAQQLDRAIPTLAYPALEAPASTVLHPSKGDTKGVVVTYVPRTSGDPIQSLLDRKFYFRNGDEFAEMPYEILKRMFTGAAGPDLEPIFDSRIVKLNQDSGEWEVPIALANKSSAAGEQVHVLVDILNPDACAKAEAVTLKDMSAINPGHMLFIGEVEGVVHKGLNSVVGSLRILMKKGKRARRVLNLRLEIFANRMRARRWLMRIQLAKKGFSVRSLGDEYVD